MQDITQSIGEHSHSLKHYTATILILSAVIWLHYKMTSKHQHRPPRLSSTLALRFFYCLWSLNHPQRDFPSNTDGHPQVCTLVAFYIWYKSLPRQCQLLCRMDTSIFRRRIGKNIEIYCCCILQNYREPIQCQCIPSNNTLNYV